MVFLHVNPQYTFHLGISNTRNVHILNNVSLYILNNNNLNIVDSVKDLSVIVTSDLSWHMNVVEVVNKANNLSNAIIQVFCNHDINL